MVTSISRDSKATFSAEFPKWQKATWEDYCAYWENSNLEDIRLFFNAGYLLVDMGNEGINHASVAQLFSMLFFIWFSRFPERRASDLGGCVIEKPKKQSGSPDIALYIGENIPQWQAGEQRRINLDKWRVPDLVGEVSDTTIAIDLDEKKQLYAALEIPEYWVIDLRGKRAIAFLLQANGKYQQCDRSGALAGLPMSLLEEALHRLSQETNISVARWFGEAIANLQSSEV
jgi:Uma2 family endonuclease